jgi:hypothetical protein
MGSLNNESGYIQLSNDRSHLIGEVISTNNLVEKPFLDIYDIVIIVTNIILVLYISFNYLKYKKYAEFSSQKEIHLVVSDKNSSDFPFFQGSRKKIRNPTVKKTETKDSVPTAQNPNSAHNILELKCTKCNYTTEIYEKNVFNAV